VFEDSLETKYRLPSADCECLCFLSKDLLRCGFVLEVVLVTAYALLIDLSTPAFLLVERSFVGRRSKLSLFELLPGVLIFDRAGKFA
jgi:hypothetical protein